MKNFWSKVEKTETCWNWKASTNNSGYGMFGNGKKIVLAHRFSYETLKGKIPKGKQLDHLCRNRLCVNPEHLDITTCRDNILRGVGIASINSKKTHCKRGHELTHENLIPSALKVGLRSCKACYILRGKELI